MGHKLSGLVVKKLSSLCVVLWLLCTAQHTYAQAARDEFGKNRIQYKNFKWQYYSTENFDVYFYQEGEEYARLAAEFLEIEFERITDLLGYAPYSKTKIFLYNSVSDHQQSNIGLEQNRWTIGGQTNFVKLQVEIAYPGTMAGFKDELRLRIARMLINDMMFGGSLADMFQSAYLLSLPQWFMDGAALYVAKGWDVKMDDYVRDFFGNRKFKKLKKLSEEDAQLMGQSVWNFIAVRYGKSNISNILNLTRIIRNEENSIASTLGMPFKQFAIEWESYYRNGSKNIYNTHTSPDKKNRFVGVNKKGFVYHQMKISPDGTKVAYSENDRGKYRVKIANLSTGKSQNVLTRGFKLINQPVAEDVPALSWIDDATLGIIDVHKGSYGLVQYDLNARTKVRKPLDRFNQVKDVTFNGNGRLAVISADVNGQNDLYLLSMRRNAVRRLTDDIFDDINPMFIKGTDAIVFSSNRTSDELRVTQNDLDSIDANFNLFLYDLDTTENTVVRLTNTLSRDYNPKPVDENTIYYLSDQKGIVNLYRFDLKDTIFQQVSNFNTSIENYDINTTTGQISYSLLNKGRRNLYLDEEFDLSQTNFTPQTLRQDIRQARFITERIRKRKAELEEQEKATIAEETNKQPEVREIPEELSENLTDIINTDNYQFDQSTVTTKKETSSESFLSNYRKLETADKLTGPYPYETQFSADNIVTSFIIDPLRGFGIQLETQMNDLLENHKFYGGILAIADLRSGDIFGEYQYLKHQVDFHFRYDRSVVLMQAENTLQKYVLNKYEVGGSLPISTTTRFTLSPFFATTRYLDLDFRTLQPAPPPFPVDVTTTYGGIRSEIVYDNSVAIGLNMYQGTRAKVGLEIWGGLNDASRSFNKFVLDLRHYQKIHREITIAGRLFYGKFFGQNQQNFLLGGMNNWLFKNTDNTGDEDPLNVNTGVDNSNILFVDFIPLRGYNFNKFNGGNVLTFSAELRLPLIRYLINGPIASNFFRNLMFTGFYEVGSAWTGVSPFNESNSVNTRVIRPEGSVFQATIRSSRSPWLQSYGFGVRTVLLGYYMKFDFAWPVEDFEVGGLKFYVTLGYDF